MSPAEITFDPAKDVTNTAKHGVSLALASELEWADLMAQADTRRDYGEDRMIGYTPIGERVFCVVFMDRDDQRRIISLRKANAREVKRYASQI
ncbi:BrnT family toxin [Acidiferrobacter sp. SPIII_3]|uniref:BrnT family toxin n=1 Tax=Acidiferrobacter sp. SPIII_3 TaxID=1281578 RepID=UPI00351AA754